MWSYRYRDNFIAQQRTATGSASSGCAGLCFGLSITASRDTVACGHRQKPTNRRKQFQLSPQNEAAITTTHGRRRCHLFSIRVRNLFPSLTHNVTRRQPAPFPHRYAMSMESRSRSSFRLVTFSRRVFNGVGCLWNHCAKVQRDKWEGGSLEDFGIIKKESHIDQIETKLREQYRAARKVIQSDSSGWKFTSMNTITSNRTEQFNFRPVCPEDLEMEATGPSYRGHRQCAHERQQRRSFRWA